MGVEDYLWNDYSKTDVAKTQVRQTGNSELDKDAFLRLLLTQLQYQDPLNPMEDKDFVAQMAQFSALEQMQNMNKTTTNSQAFSLVGKYVVGQSYNELTNSYSYLDGTVDSVRIVKGEAILIIGEEELKLSDVSQVFDDLYTSNLLNGIQSNIINSQGVNIVGKYIQALVNDADGNPTEFIEGKVDNVRFSDGSPVFMVGNKLVMPGNVMNVSEEPLLVGKTISAFVGNDDNAYGLREGKIKTISASGGKLYATIENEDGSFKVLMNDVDTVIQAVRSVGATATAGGETGVITSVYMADGDVMAVIGGKEYNFNDIKV